MPPRIGLGAMFLTWVFDAVLLNSLRLPFLDNLLRLISFSFFIFLRLTWCQSRPLHQVNWGGPIGSVLVKHLFLPWCNIFTSLCSFVVFAQATAKATTQRSKAMKKQYTNGEKVVYYSKLAGQLEATLEKQARRLKFYYDKIKHFQDLPPGEFSTQNWDSDLQKDLAQKKS